MAVAEALVRAAETHDRRHPPRPRHDEMTESSASGRRLPRTARRRRGHGQDRPPAGRAVRAAGATVTGYDIDPARVAEINAGRIPLTGEPGLDELPTLVTAGALRATADPRDAVSNADVIILIVPVDVDDRTTPTSLTSTPRPMPSPRTFAATRW